VWEKRKTGIDYFTQLRKNRELPRDCFVVGYQEIKTTMGEGLHGGKDKGGKV